MNSYRIVWEDESKAREVEIFIEYTVTAGSVEVDAIRPTKVTFYNEATKTPVRSIGVHTRTGRTMLSNAYLSGRGIDFSLADEISSEISARDEMSAAQPAG